MSEHTNDTRSIIVAAARRLIGVRFRHGGRSAQGVDCIGLLTVAYASAGITLNAPGDYAKRPTVPYAFAQAASFASRIDASDAGPGDIVQMSYGRAPVHFGILTEASGVVHSAALLRRVVENSLPKSGEGRAIAYWRVEGVPAWHN